MSYNIYNPGLTNEEINKIAEFEESSRLWENEVIKNKYPELYELAFNFVQEYKKELLEGLDYNE